VLPEITAVFLICLIGAGLTTYALGKKEGIKGTIEYLIEEGLIEVDE
jgi:hypothetical protein